MDVSTRKYMEGSKGYIIIPDNLTVTPISLKLLIFYECCPTRYLPMRRLKACEYSESETHITRM